MTTFHISDRAELLSALKTAQGGETFVLAEGDYGALSISTRYADTLRIVSETPGGAVFSTVSLHGAANITLDAITTTSWIKAERGASEIEISNSQIGDAAYFRDASAISLHDNDIAAGTYGIVLNSISGFTITGNTVQGAQEDLLRITGNSHDGLIEGNMLRDVIATKGTHPDIIQLIGLNGVSPHDITIRGNLLYDDISTGETVAQGIFMSDPKGTGYYNILIENNLIRTNSPNTIYINGGEDNVVIRNNTLMPGDGDGGAFIRLANKGAYGNSGVTLEDNVAKILLDETRDSTIGDNYIYGRGADLSALFQGGSGAEWADYLPVPGSPIDLPSGYGAGAWLADFLAGAAVATLHAGPDGFDLLPDQSAPALLWEWDTPADDTPHPPSLYDGDMLV